MSISIHWHRPAIRALAAQDVRSVRNGALMVNCRANRYLGPGGSIKEHHLDLPEERLHVHKTGAANEVGKFARIDREIARYLHYGK